MHGEGVEIPIQECNYFYSQPLDAALTPRRMSLPSREPSSPILVIRQRIFLPSLISPAATSDVLDRVKPFFTLLVS